MSIRNQALNWYQKKYGQVDTPIYTSKFYKPFESWPKANVWWPQVPVSAIEENTFIHILCETTPGSNDFYHLKIPTQFLRENLIKFHTIGEKIVDFYFSTDPNKLFSEERGEGSLDFRKFLQNEV